MYGAIIGDLAGSLYEYIEFKDMLNKKINYNRRINCLHKNEIINLDSFYSDDTILTIAVLDSIISGDSYYNKLKEYGKKYSEVKINRKNYFEHAFSPTFIKWCNDNQSGDSIGNGSAMRVSPIGYLYDNLKRVIYEAKQSSMPSHNSLDAIRGAQAIAATIFLSRNKVGKEDIKKYIETNFNYDLNMDLVQLQKFNKFSGIAEKTVPQSIYIFLSSNSFEDSILKSLSIGGDTDTIGAMVGSMSEAYYGIPKKLVNQAREKLPTEFTELVDKGYSKIIK